MKHLTIKMIAIISIVLVNVALFYLPATAQELSTNNSESLSSSQRSARHTPGLSNNTSIVDNSESALSVNNNNIMYKIKELYKANNNGMEPPPEVTKYLTEYFKNREHELANKSDYELWQETTTALKQMQQESQAQEQRNAEILANDPNAKVTPPAISSSTLTSMVTDAERIERSYSNPNSAPSTSQSFAPTATSTPAPQNNEPVIVNMEPTAPAQAQQEGQPAVIEPTQQYSAPFDPVYQNEAEPQQATSRPATISDMIQAAATSEVTEGAIPQAAPLTQTKEPESFPEAIAMTLQGVGAAIASNEVLRAGIIALPILLIALFGGFAISRNEDYQPKVEVKGRVRRRKKAKESDIPQDTSGDVPFRATKINILTAAE